MVEEVGLAAHCLVGRQGKKCVYVGKTADCYTCDYCLITGKLRRVPIEDCEHWRENVAMQIAPASAGVTGPPKKWREMEDEQEG